MANPDQAIERLETAWKVLGRRWEETRRVWQDANAREFERRYWEPLSREVPPVLQEMKNVAETLHKALRNVP